MNHPLGNLAKGVQIGIGFCAAVIATWTAVTYAAAAW